MVSNAPNSLPYDFRSMYDIPDLRGCLPKKGYNSESMMGVISQHPDFTRFKYIMELSKLAGIYNDPQADFTLFVPSDQKIAHIPESVFTNMDNATARNIVKTSTLNLRISSELLGDSPAAYFTTNNKTTKLFISNISGTTYVNNCLKVIHSDLETSNGLLHVIDGLLWPETI